MFKLAAQNILMLIVFWLLAVALIAVGNDVWHFSLKEMLRKTDSRSTLSVYQDHEYAAKIFNDQKVANFDYVPFIEWRHRQYASETLNVDQHGYRGNGEHAGAVDGAANRTTVGIFGGSTIWGTGVDDSSTIPSFFQAANPDLAVTNMGERGHTMRQNLDELINMAVSGTMPQVAVFYGGFNDVWVHCNYTNTKGLNGHIREQRLRNALATTEDSRSSVYQLFIEPVLELFSMAPGGKQFLPACSNDPKRAAAVAEMLIEDWQIAHDLVVRHGGQFYAFLQPNAHVGSPNISYLGLEDSRVLRGDEYRAVYPLVAKIARERNLTWFDDLSNVLDGDNIYYIDDAHLGPEGNKAVAQQISDRLQGKLAAAAP